MDEVEIPSYFLCPISLQIMRDPVTLPSGITFDRDSIERWLFSGTGHNICPVTKQPLPASDVCTPNHTLRRLIQAWCVVNASSGFDRIPTPRTPVDRSFISDLLKDPNRSTVLRKLHEIVSASESNRICVEASEATEFLVSLVEDRTSDEALAILHSLRISEQRLLGLIKSRPKLIDSLFEVLHQSSYKYRAYAVMLLKSSIPLVSPTNLASFGEDRLHAIGGVLRDRISNQATKAALQVLIELISWGRNRVKAVQTGAVYVLVDLLLEETDKRASELALVALDKLCACADGRAELLGHAAGIAAVSKKILRVSAVASERAVRILEKVAKLSATPALLQEMLHVGAVSKLCLVLQVDCGKKEKAKAKEILSLHARIWKKSPCLSPQILLSYPLS